MAKCGACGKFMPTSEGAKINCSKCNKFLHKECVGIDKNITVSSSWICPECKLKLPKSNKDNTPVKMSDAQISGAGMPITRKEDMWQEFIIEMRTFREEMRESMHEVREAIQEFRLLKEELQELRSAVSACESRMDGMRDTVESLLEREASADDHLKMIETLRSNIVQLQMDLNERNRELLLCDIELSGVPEMNGENPVHLIMACATKLGVVLEEKDIVSCARVGPVRAEAGARPRPIVVRLSRRAIRTDLLRAARARRHLTTEGMGLGAEPRAWYLNERLTRDDRQLFYKTREAARRHSWRFVWTKEGRIYVRKHNDAIAKRMRSDADLDRVFHSENFRSPHDATV